MLRHILDARRADLARVAGELQLRFPEVRSLTAIIGGTALGQALVLASTPAISRLYSQAEIGVFGLFLSFLGVAGTAVTARYELAIPGAGDDAEAAALLSLSLRLSLLLSVPAAAALWWLIAHDLLSFGRMPPWAILAALPATAAAGAFAAVRLWLVRERRFGAIGGAVVWQGAGRAAVPILYRLTASGALGLVGGELVGRLFGLYRMLASGRATLARVAAMRPSLRAVGAAHWKNPAVLLPSGLINALALALPVPLISTRFGLPAAGTFVLVQRLGSIPSALIGTGAGDVFHSNFVTAYGRTTDDARGTLRAAGRHLLLVGLATLLPCAILAPTVIPWLLGSRWNESGWLFVAIVPWAIANFVLVPLSRVLVVVDRKEAKIVYDVTALLMMVGTITAGARWGLGFVATLALTSAGQVLAYLLYFLLLDWAATRRGGSRDR